jgi:hypothetical protein
MSDKVLDEVRAAASLTGIFEATEKSLFDDFETVLAKRLPERIGIVDRRSGARYNAERASSFEDSLFIGTMLLGLGVLGILRRAWTKKRRRVRRAEAVPA